MNASSDYIIRIYRFEKNKPQSLIGVVEEVGIKGKKAFNTYDELWQILNKTKRHRLNDGNTSDHKL